MIEFEYSTLHGDVVGSAFVKLLDQLRCISPSLEVEVVSMTPENLKLHHVKTTVMSYYLNVKNWLLEKYPEHRNTIEQRLLKMERALEGPCMQRHQGGVVTKAPACTMVDLRSLVGGLYFDATASKE
ncbi:hypothetical protein P3T76_015363 [Phytophthora citrophthora]|uniref:Uncharacterized protein n=1 Tax=Phytophthora citrophthora TaxID=4793 RepID=A0AAD9FZG9_9STRA|nr:hypothetical protein P3T76_015363 [Phytophthora citrophthora]